MSNLISIDQHDTFDLIKSILSKRQSSPDSPHWLIGNPNFDEGESFCFDCMKMIEPDGSWGDEWDGGFSSESDGCVHCAKCGKLLEYTLTDYGVTSELNHFSEHPPQNLDDTDECFHLARIAYGIYTDEQKLKFLSIFKGISIADSEGMKNEKT